MTDTGPRKAWRVTWKGTTSVVSETTRGRAIRAVVSSASEAGYSPRWVDVRAARAPEYDGWASRTAGRAVYAEECVAKGQTAEEG